jgi:hypothetical protein
MPTYMVNFTEQTSKVGYSVRMDLDPAEIKVNGETFKSIKDASEKAKLKLNKIYGAVEIKSIEQLTE